MLPAAMQMFLSVCVCVCGCTHAQREGKKRLLWPSWKGEISTEPKLRRSRFALQRDAASRN